MRLCRLTAVKVVPIVCIQMASLGRAAHVH
jgi:hypothetical protein